MAPKVVIENAVLQGSQYGSVQIVARVYATGGEEFRVNAPEHATGSALDWIPQLHVRTQSKEMIAGEEITDGRAPSIIQHVQAELEKQKLEADIWKPGINEDGRFYATQICLQGHVLRSSGDAYERGEHCPKCGKVCIDACPDCGTAIRGQGTWDTTRNYKRPEHCHKCGRAYPWMQDRLETAKQLLYHDDKLSIAEKEENWGLLQYVMTDPKSDKAPAKKKLFEIGIAKALPATREFFLDLMAKLGAEMLKP